MVESEVVEGTEGNVRDAQELLKGSPYEGRPVIVIGGGSDAIMTQLRALEREQPVYTIRDFDPSSLDEEEDEEPAQVEDRPEVMLLGCGDRNNVGLNVAIAAVLSKAFEVIEEPIGFRLSRQRPMFDPDMFFFPTCYEVEFRWTDLHHRLSLQGTQMKLERQQQRRKALFKFHQEKRAKRGKEHAKQKHKGVSRFS